jgi:hypothetical protein
LKRYKSEIGKKESDSNSFLEGAKEGFMKGSLIGTILEAGLDIQEKVTR